MGTEFRRFPNRGYRSFPILLGTRDAGDSMTKDYMTLDGRPQSASRPVYSKADRSKQILSGTTTGLAILLLIWLAVTPFLSSPLRMNGIAITMVPRELMQSIPPLLSTSGRSLGNMLFGERMLSADTLAEVERHVEEGPAPTLRKPRIITLVSVGIAAEDGDGTEIFFLQPGADSALSSSSLRAGQFFDLLSNQENGRGPTLVILDVGHLDTDRHLGVFGNGFFEHLSKFVSDKGNLVVLASSGPGQINWSAEPFGRSIFAEAVARSSQWGTGTAYSLFEDVAHQVAAWSLEFRHAEQTPILLGNLSLARKLRLPARQGMPPSDEASSPEVLPEDLARLLIEAWKDHERHAKSQPYQRSPIRWRTYQLGLLQAEQLIRVGRFTDAEQKLRETVWSARPASTAGLDQISLAILEDQLPESSRDRLVNYRETLRELEEAAFSVNLGSSDQGLNATDDPSNEGEGEAVGPGPNDPGGTTRNPLRESLSTAPPAEGRLVDRYRIFVNNGGESEELRPRRVDAIRFALDVAKQGEVAAAVDGQLIEWVRAEVEEGDRLRLEAQDLVFSQRAEDFATARDLLSEANRHYENAIDIAKPLERALNLLNTLRHDLPYYGSWLASTPSGSTTRLKTLLTDAKALADAIESKAGSDPLGKVEASLAQVTREFEALESLFKSAVETAKSDASLPDWRVLDAILQVPYIAAETRIRLLERIRDPSLSLIAESTRRSAGTSIEPNPDTSFWKRALGLSELEAGLLALGGFETDELLDDLDDARAWKNDLARAFAAMARFSSQVQELRRTHLDATISEKDLDLVSRKDGLIRILPVPKQVARAELRLGHDFQELMVWQAERAAEDLDLNTANAALRIARRATSVGPEQFAQVQRLIDTRARQLSNAIAVRNNNPANAATVEPIRVTVNSPADVDLPEGRGVLILRSESGASVPLDESSRATASIEVPLNSEQQLPPLNLYSLESTTIQPIVFYRGAIFVGQIAAVSSSEQVRVSIHQRYTRARLNDVTGLVPDEKGKITIPDQFALPDHQFRGYLLPNGTLDFRIELTNQTTEPLTAVVVRKLSLGRTYVSDPVKIPPLETIPEADLGRILSVDFPEDGSNISMEIEVHEGGSNGRLLARMQNVEFIVLNPKDYITPIPFRVGNDIGMQVYHKNIQAGTAPTQVEIAVEPSGNFLELGTPRAGLIPVGSSGYYRYRLIRPTGKMKFTLTIDGITQAYEEEHLLSELTKEQDLPEEGDPNVVPKGDFKNP